MSPKRKIFIYLALGVLFTAFAVFIYYFRGKIAQIFIPFFIALIMAYVLRPMVAKMERKGIRRSIAILLLYLFFLLGMVTVVIFVVPELVNNTKELVRTVPELDGTYRGMMDGLISTIQSTSLSPDLKSMVYNEIRNVITLLQNFALDMLRKTMMSLIEMIAMFFDFLLALVIAYYFIKDAEFFREATLYFTPRKWRSGLVSTGREINLILSNFIQGQLLTAFIVGILETVGLLIVRVKYPLVLGMIGGIANIIPYFGPFIGAVPAVVISLLESPMKAVWTVVVFVIVQQIDNSFISPKIIEGRLGLHPVTTILAVLIGGEFFGIIGMLVSVPMMAIVKVILKRAVEAIV